MNRFSKSKVLSATVGAFAVLAMAGSVTALAATNPAVQGNTTVNTERNVNSLVVSPNLTNYVYTANWYKKYYNLYNINVATHSAFTQWVANSSYNVSKRSLWQNDSTAIGYGFENEVDVWNYFYSGDGQARSSVKFTSGLPTPWGNIGGPSFTSTILTDVYPGGSSQGY